MRLASVFVLSVCLGLCAGMLPAEEFAVGIARVKITPEKPIRMSGYAARNKPSVGVLQDLWAKCLAIRDAEGHRIVILTTDLIGYNNEFSTELFTRAKEEYGLNREEILLTCSHTHSGPVVGKNLRVMYQFSPEEAETIREYTSQLLDKLVMIIGQALENLQPAQLSVGHGKVGFAVNRREKRGEYGGVGGQSGGPCRSRCASDQSHIARRHIARGLVRVCLSLHNNWRQYRRGFLQDSRRLCGSCPGKD